MEGHGCPLPPQLPILCRLGNFHAKEPNPMSITLSENAAKEIKSIIKDQGLADNDEITESHGVKILSDRKSYLYLNNTEIDFKDEVMGRGFVFKNPNATHTCGCGSSFSA